MTKLERLKQKEERLHEIKLMKCGEYCEIIEYRKMEDIDVKFEDGTIIKNKKYSKFKVGEINKGIKYSTNRHKDISGEKYGKLTITKLHHKTRYRDKYNYFYECKCDCGNDVIREFSNLRFNRDKIIKSCGKCSTVKIEDSVYSTNPNILKYFKDINDAKENTYGSNKKCKFICDCCNIEKEMSIRSFILNGIRCQTCSDKISYPEKVLRSFLNQLEVEYETEKKFEWSLNKRYDFYIPSLNCIIETHGKQHYKESSLTKRTLIEEVENDIMKREFANNNNISNYIQLNCSDSSFEYIKKSIENSKLSDIFDLTNFSWEDCELNSIKPVVKQICDIYNNIEKEIVYIEDIQKIIKMDIRTIENYLKIGNKLGLCEIGNIKKYKKRNRQTRYVKVKCIELDMNFNSIKNCVEYLNDLNNDKYAFSAITAVCQGKRKTHKGYHFEYLEK